MIRKNVVRTKDRKTLSPAKAPKNVVIFGSNENMRNEKNDEEMSLKRREKKVPDNGAKKCCRTKCLGTATMLRVRVVTLDPYSNWTLS